MANAIGKVIQNITEYIEIKTEQIKLKIVARLARTLSAVLSSSFVAMMGLFFILFLSFAVALSLNSYFENDYAGFYIIAGFYFLIILITFILVKTKKIQRWFESLIIKIAEQEDEQDD